MKYIIIALLLCGCMPYGGEEFDLKVEPIKEEHHA